MLVRKSRPLKLASSAPFRSRKLKVPFLMLTRRTSGATANPGSRLGGLLWRASSAGGETLVDVAGTTGTGFVVMGAFSVSKWPTVAADCVEIGGDCASCEPGNLHFPSASCGHTTVGFTSATSLITSLLEKSESSEPGAEMFLLRGNSPVPLRSFAQS